MINTNEVCYIAGSQDFQKLLVAGEAPRNVARYYTFLSELEKFKTVSKRLPEVKVAPGKEVSRDPFSFNAKAQLFLFHCTFEIPSTLTI